MVMLIGSLALAIPLVLIVWGLWPLISSRDSSTYRRFILTDMYMLVLQIAAAGMSLRQWTRDDERFLIALVCTALVLALIWRFIVAALDDNNILGNRQRVTVLTIAPLQILFGPVAPMLGLSLLSNRNAEEYALYGYMFMALGILIPITARRIYQWALRAKKLADIPASPSSN